jgi:hypothetical protein
MLVVANKRTFPAPNIVATNLNGWAIRYGNDATQRIVTAEAMAVIDAANPTRQNVCMIYVPSIYTTPDLIVSDRPASGTAIAPYYFTNTVNVTYLGNAFVSATRKRPFTFVHELCHLFDLTHVPEQWNLMFQTTSPTKAVTGTKRLTQAQDNKMKESGYIK